MTTHDGRPGGPGVKWRRRRRGPPVPCWFADQKGIKAGYPVKFANLSAYAADPIKLKQRAARLQAEMLDWMTGGANRTVHFDGTFKALFDLYETDQQSTYRQLKARTRASYDVYIRRLRVQIGARRIDGCDGRDVLRWFAEWRVSKGVDRLPRARFALAVLNAAISWGIVCKAKGCADFQTITRQLVFEGVPARTQAPTAEQMIAARKAAHANRAPLRALCYALQFDTTLRQEDVVGQWLPLEEKKISAVHAGKSKWVGPKWSDIGDDWSITVKPTKTERKTDITMSFDLSVCPMVMEELALLAAAEVEELRRDLLPTSGPIIVNHRTRLPYRPKAFNEGWRKDYAIAEIPTDVWNRDTRAGAVTEGTKAGVSKDDQRRLAGHSREETTDIYE